MTPDWLIPIENSIAQAHASAHLPHALLIHEAPVREGVARPVDRAAGVVLRSAGPQPCGSCVSCQRVAHRQHPDLLVVRPLEDSRQLRIEQVRELAEELALTSHQGGYKVGVLSPADALNRFAANALLKTLEEPTANTLLILVAVEPSRLPATILSRCQRIRIPAPSRAAQLRWLRATCKAGRLECGARYSRRCALYRRRKRPRGSSRNWAVRCARPRRTCRRRGRSGSDRRALEPRGACAAGCGALRTGSRNAFAEVESPPRLLKTVRCALATRRRAPETTWAVRADGWRA